MGLGREHQGSYCGRVAFIRWPFYGLVSALAGTPVASACRADNPVEHGSLRALRRPHRGSGCMLGTMHAWYTLGTAMDRAGIRNSDAVDQIQLTLGTVVAQGCDLSYRKVI
jgi:hypothetical protein